MTAGRRPTVLVTRPQPGAARTATVLRAAGFEPLVLPFTEIAPLAVDPAAIDAARKAGGVAVTSANAIAQAPPPLLGAIAGRPVFAVGEATARKARKAGLAPVVSADGDATDLARLVDAQSAPSARVAYLCGRIRTGALETALAATGRDIVLVETYQAKKVSGLTDKWRELVQSRKVDAILLHSGLAARIAVQLLDADSERQGAANVDFFAISERVGRELCDAAKARLHIARAPREDALIAALGAVYARP
ncbi:MULTISPECIES: uroporphyrinogen-III synthase [unclassified Roseitalea]|uniref:uroporphyrinogen-III synthase n=1 Tax=unclassified Roseitalea TaxID=2639107 RepID=UPI00273F0477|nr:MULTISPECIES: uroporphyrinogen-III synthase [unclassified Roseitalea]